MYKFVFTRISPTKLTTRPSATMYTLGERRSQPSYGAVELIGILWLAPDVSRTTALPVVSVYGEMWQRFDHIVQRLDLRQEWFQLVQWQSARPVTFCLIRIRVSF